MRFFIDDDFTFKGAKGVSVTKDAFFTEATSINEATSITEPTLPVGELLIRFINSRITPTMKL